jgi:hypothetical protein
MKSKFDFRHLLAGAFAFIISMMILLGFVLSLSSCGNVKPNARKQKNHYDKFIKYGGKIDTVERTITITQVIKGKDGKDSLIYIDVPVKCPEPKIEYKDRWYIKHLAKAEKDSLIKDYNHKEKMSKIRSKAVSDSLNGLLQLEKAKKKTAKAEKGSSIIWIILAISFMLTTILLLWKNLIHPRLSRFL